MKITSCGKLGLKKDNNIDFLKVLKDNKYLVFLKLLTKY
jgi:hypothetical protein